MNLGYVLGALLPLLFGTGVWTAFAGMPQRRAELCAMLGYGGLLGLCAAGLLVGLVRPDATTRLLPGFGPVLAAGAALLWFIASRRGDSPAARVPTPLGRLPRWVAIVALVLLAGRAVFLIEEVLLRPVFPWDAWWVWAARAKAWFLGGHFDAVVPPERWLDAGGEPLRITLAYTYPELVSWIELWLAAANGAWNEPLIHLAWVALWIGLLLGLYGQWRLLGVARREAALAVYALGSLPLLDVHVALAGYVDLWSAMAFAFATTSWLRWIEQRDRGQLGLAIVLVLLMPLLKFEGLVWGASLAGLMALAATPRRYRLRGLAALAAGGGLLVLASAWLDLAWVRVARDLLSGASGGHAVSWGGIVRAIGSGMFVQYNWHLLWYALPIVLLWRRRQIAARPALRYATWLLLSGFAFMFALFFLTPAAKWAESYTAINRLLLQMVPLAITLGLLALRDPVAPPALADTADPSTRPSAPG